MSDETDLFREAMAGVAPLQHDKVEPAKSSLDPNLAYRKQLAAATLKRVEDPNYLTVDEVEAVAPYDFVAWKKAGVQEGVFRKLRLGKYPLDERLDLHGHNVRDARRALFSFIQSSIACDRRTLLILHGKGETSATPGRLKSYVVHWLGQLAEVIAYHTAMRSHGGYGATYALLRKSRASAARNLEAHGGKAGLGGS